MCRHFPIVRSVHAIHAQKAQKLINKGVRMMQSPPPPPDQCLSLPSVAKKVKITASGPPVKKHAIRRVPGPLEAAPRLDVSTLVNSINKTAAT